MRSLGSEVSVEQYYNHFTKWFTAIDLKIIPNLCELLGIQLFTITLNGELTLNYKKIMNNNIHKFFSHISASTLIYLSYSIQQYNEDNNNNQMICKTLSGVYFRQLKVLSLAGNSIKSIQMLLKVVGNGLQMLNIGDNNISQGRSIRKMQLRNCMALTIECNKLVQIDRCIVQGDYKQLKVVDLWNNCIGNQSWLIIKSSNQYMAIDKRDNNIVKMSKKHKFMMYHKRKNLFELLKV